MALIDRIVSANACSSTDTWMVSFVRHAAD